MDVTWRSYWTDVGSILLSSDAFGAQTQVGQRTCRRTERFFLGGVEEGEWGAGGDVVESFQVFGSIASGGTAGRPEKQRGEDRT